MRSGALTVGFDLDMTLVDSRPGIRACYEELSAETGVPIDADLVVARLGPPLEHELANWFPADEVPALAVRYRQMYPEHAITGTVALPGAHAAVEAVHARGGRVIVVTGKYEPNAKLHLTQLNIAADAVIGDLWAEQKAEALREYEANVYVGDHVGDIRGARAAAALAVGVTTGPCAVDELTAAGADVVLSDLTEFPAWWAEFIA
ncbi:haloacid dehalogenase-like hydrolase [Nocardia nova]